MSPRVRSHTFAALVLALAFTACAGSEAVPDRSDADAAASPGPKAKDGTSGDDGDDDFDDGSPREGGKRDADASTLCCPIAEFPTCDCMYVGGVRDKFGACSKVCDARHVGKAVDDYGCPYWVSTGESCLGGGGG